MAGGVVSVTRPSRSSCETLARPIGLVSRTVQPTAVDGRHILDVHTCATPPTERGDVIRSSVPDASLDAGATSCVVSITSVALLITLTLSGVT
ncbi:MAG: hypothetical protein U0326_29610 [Polyangiales bacterium]